MFCQACGADNSEDARFCNMCGTTIAKPGTPGGMVANGTVKGTGEAPPVRAEAPAPVGGADSTVRAPEAAAPPGRAEPQGVWDQAGASVAGRSYAGGAMGGGGGVSGIGNATLAGVGVQSSKRAWTIIIVIAICLVGFGALAGWALTGGEPEPEDYDPEVAENQAEIGLPLPEGVEMPDEAIFDAVPGGGVTPSSMGSAGGGASAMGGGASPGGGGQDEGPPPTTTVVGSSMGSSTTTMAGSGTTTMTGSGTTTMTGSGATTMTGSGTTTMTGSGTTTMTGSGTTTMAGSGTGTLPSDAPEERDIAMSMYSQRVRFVIARYYASRAQTCFDLASRNSPDVSGEVRIRLDIGADGQVTDASPVANTTGNATLGQCLAGRVKQWRLPPPPDGALTMVLPFRN